ncbi:hypothetical protein [Aquimarina sp. 2201CG5-10]|uniref:hypothetical protein n=1 Tax=Aquimarina callyspongiae TaxID=3098150 RepID=UPI002AB3FFCD|nr:hypothetical protein [Aquimarina sp. 2201CG5-10]MDY8134676.1 hypothetical protein [Aquimarina sp. 2201CG5-10]
MKLKVILHKNILLFIFLIGLLFTNVDSAFSQNTLCKPCPELAKYFAGKHSKANKHIQYAGFNIPKNLEVVWKNFPAVRKIETAYKAAENRKKGNGERFLAKLKTSIGRNFESVHHDSKLKDLVDDEKRVKFKNLKQPGKITVNKNVQTQILAISKYTETGAFGGIRGVLQYKMEIPEDDVYEILRESNSFTDAFERGLHKAKIPPSQQERIRILIKDLMKKYPSAKDDKILIQFLEKHKKIRAKITEIVINEIVVNDDIIAVFESTDEIESITKTKKYQDFVEVAPEYEIEKLTINTFKKANISKQSSYNELLKFIRKNIQISDNAINPVLYEPIESFITIKTEEIFIKSYNGKEENIKQDLKTCKEEFKQLLNQKTENNKKLKSLMTELANERVKNVSNNTFAEIESYYKNVDNHLNTISENSRWEKIRKDFRNRINYNNLGFKNNQIEIFKMVLDDWDNYKNKNKFKWFNSNIDDLEELFHNYSKSSGKIKACWGFILQQQGWDGAVHYYTEIAPNPSARGNPYYLLNYYYNSTNKDGKIERLYDKVTNFWVGRLCPPH